MFELMVQKIERKLSSVSVFLIMFGVMEDTVLLRRYRTVVIS